MSNQVKYRVRALLKNLPKNCSAISTINFVRMRVLFTIKHFGLKIASAGNRTRATRVAGENSTTEPPMLT